ncbi:MAG TPA: GFA family protein [Caulobacteraceae bacterium]
MSGPALEGGCACGRVRYRVEAEPSDAGYCHCTVCRRSSGAPALAFASVPLDAFRLTAAEPERRRSSSFGERWFCGGCGAQIAMRVDYDPDLVDFTLATLDDPMAVTPGFHIWREERIGWFETADGLPRHARSRRETEAPA